MKSKSDVKGDKWEALQDIIDKYSKDELVLSRAYSDGSVDPLWPRFDRAAGNQLTEGEATVSRYAIWANTVCDNLIESLKFIEKNDIATARILIIRAANSMSAFADVQALVDPFANGNI